MIRAAILAAFAVCLTHVLMHVPGEPQYAPLPTASAVYLPIPQAMSGCPGGVCPLPQPAVRVVPQQPRVVAPAAPVGSPHSRGQWSYPGDVYSHLAEDHGVNAAGMSLHEAESLHSAIHEGRSTVPVKAVSMQACGTTQARYVTSQPVRSFVRAQPLRNIVRARPVRSLVRRVFCR